MKPDAKSKTLLGITRSKAKMIEFGVPAEHHIEIKCSPAGLFPLTIGILGDLAAELCRIGENQKLIAQVKQELRFAACFFDAFREGIPQMQNDDYLQLLTAAAYYLCDLSGSSLVLTKRLSDIPKGSDESGLKHTLLWYLKAHFDRPLLLDRGALRELVAAATEQTCRFYSRGGNPEGAFGALSAMRKIVYADGSPRELLLADLVFGVAKRRVENSARVCLPKYTGIPIEGWEPVLQKHTFLREFWPAQRLLGEQDVFRGRSAIVQMPTSAGKTRATEVLIRSSFLAKRAVLAVVVAPFRALCHEIRDSMLIAFQGEDILINEISDVPQSDFDLEIKEGQPQVLILTPEKLFYLLRQKPEIAKEVGLLIYDEGHQFDSGIRGVTYELLLSSLKKVVPKTCQVVLISAVISNAAAINNWLNGENGSVVTGTDLHPSLKSVAFASWQDARGRLEFLGQVDSGNHDFFVPRIIESTALTRFSNREHERIFPKRDDEETVALYLALKIVRNGSVAIFCGKKSTVTSVCEILADAHKRDLKLQMPVDVSDKAECHKIRKLIVQHLGKKNSTAECAALGVFTHHSITPVGVRLAIEHAMKHELIKMVVCTSTLAQGVNLPIRYLIITGVYQGERPIKVRDFQNLIGRAGRSGMHTEGSVIFANPETYDQRKVVGDGRRNWAMVEKLLDPAKSEECASSLLSLFEQIVSDNQREKRNLNAPAFYKSYYDNINDLSGFVDGLLQEFKSKEKYTKLRVLSQLAIRFRILDALESFMMEAFVSETKDSIQSAATELAKGTLAYQLAQPEQKKDLETIFQLVAQRVMSEVPDANKRKFFAKSLFGIKASLHIADWTTANTHGLAAVGSDEELLSAIWPILSLEIQNRTFKICTKPEVLLQLAILWIGDASMNSILDFLTLQEVRFGEGKRPRYADIPHVVDLCESALAYEGILVIAAVVENLKVLANTNDGLVENLEHLQKRLKYGLKSATAIVLYELGFSDRVVAAALSALLRTETNDRREVVRALLVQKERVSALIEEFPSYYTFVWNTFLRRNAPRE